ncbi:MAG TPA: alpha/beta hydrolase [bacterium]|nr:alpha/beta hydrolase [bacterium]
MARSFYQRKRFWIPFLLLLPVLAFLVYLALDPIPRFRRSVDWLLSLQGIERKVLGQGRRAIIYYEGGPRDGKAVILLHGFGGNAQFTWMRLMPALAKRYHVIAPDMLASNFLRLNPETYSVDSEVEQVLRLMDGIGVDRADFVGLSVGGWVSLILALERPEKVDRLVLVESAGLTTEIPELARLTLTDREKARRFFELLFYSPPPLPGFVLDQMIRSSTRIKTQYEAVFMGLIENSKLRLLDERVGEIKNPTLIVHGRQDRVIPLAVAERLHRLIPQSQMVILEESGHAPVWDQPAKLKSAILDFLAANPVGQGL